MTPTKTNKKALTGDDHGFKYVYMQLKAKQIKADPRYNRVISKSHVENIIKHFNKNLVNPCKVSHRDGAYWIFDGNHTLMSLIEMSGGSDDIFVDCKVYEGMTYEDEAMMFALQNGDSRKVSCKEKIRAKREANDPEVVLFTIATSAAGARCTFKSSNAPYHINCFDTAFSIFQKYGETHYMNVIRTIIKAKDGHPDSLKREIICGVDILLRLFPNIDLQRLSAKLSESNCKTIIAESKGDKFHGGYDRYAAQIGLIYNKQLGDKRKLDLSIIPSKT